MGPCGHEGEERDTQREPWQGAAQRPWRVAGTGDEVAERVQEGAVAHFVQGDGGPGAPDQGFWHLLSLLILGWTRCPPRNPSRGEHPAWQGPSAQGLVAMATTGHHPSVGAAVAAASRASSVRGSGQRLWDGNQCTYAVPRPGSAQWIARGGHPQPTVTPKPASNHRGDGKAEVRSKPQLQVALRHAAAPPASVSHL